MKTKRINLILACLIAFTALAMMFIVLFDKDDLAPPSQEDDTPPAADNEPSQDETITPPKSTEGLIYTQFDNEYYITGYEGTSSDLVIALETYNGLPVTRIKDSAFNGNQTIKSVQILVPNLELGYGAFSGCANLTSITIDESITKIPNSFFKDCIFLNVIKLHDNIESIGEGAFVNTGFYNNLTNWENGALYIDNCLIAVQPSVSDEFTVKDGTCLLANGAFRDCTSITEVVIPESVTKIPSYCFYGCSSLTKVSLPQSLTIIGNTAFFNCSSLEAIDIPKGVTDIHTYAFYNCSSLKEVDIPEGVTKISGSLFKECSALERVSIPEGVISIGEDAFESCVSLKSLELPQSLKLIQSNAFTSCEKIEKIFIGANIESIASGIFYGCTSLSEITVEQGNTHYLSYENCLIDLETKTLLAVGCNATLPDSSYIESINQYALSSCPDLKELVISRYIKKISNMNSFGLPRTLFGYCTKLESIHVDESSPYFFGEGNCVINRETGELLVGCSNSIIPKNPKVTSIGKFAFNNCENLTSITIPKNITKIQSSAFYSCENLTDVYYEGTKAEWDAIATSGWNSFGSKNCILHCTNGDFEVEYKEIIYM